MKTTILVLALLGAGGLGGQAQTNTNLNIVGYATVAFQSGFNLVANPLIIGTNGANEMFLIADGEKILTWNGSGFDTFSYETTLGGWVDANGQPTAPPVLPPGKGFFFFNPGPATNWTFTGRVVPSPGGSTQLLLPRGYSLVSSPLPASVTNITSAPVSLPLIDGMLVLTWSGSNYIYSSYDTGYGGWVDINFSPTPAPVYSIGQAFFVFNPGPPVPWVQSLP